MRNGRAADDPWALALSRLHVAFRPEYDAAMKGFQRPITVMSALQEIRGRTYVLPAIERFVWAHENVEALFDSLMRG